MQTTSNIQLTVATPEIVPAPSAQEWVKPHMERIALADALSNRPAAINKDGALNQYGS